VTAEIIQALVPTATSRPQPVYPLIDLDPQPRRASRLAVLGDSTAVGLGDPLPNGHWRGVGPFVADALGIDCTSENYLNASFTGARVRSVLTDQLPAALRLRPDVTLIIVGMNDTLRSDFDAEQLAADFETLVSRLQAAGSLVLTLRFHDHARVFRLPKSLKRALRGRIDELNAVVDTVAERTGMSCYDIGAEELAYDLGSWSVDRLHPSEFGHRMLARGFTDLVADSGFAVPQPVSLECSGGLTTGAVDHIGWLIVQGIPWLVRRGKDFLPYAAVIFARHAADSAMRRAAVLRAKVAELRGVA
jgi:lysophospholipase L1-like esterase